MITNKDIRVENGNLVLNGDKFPLDGQSPETIMEIVEDNSDTTPTENSTAPITSGGVFTALGTKQDTLTFDTTPTEASTNPVESGGVYTALAGKCSVATYNWVLGNVTADDTYTLNNFKSTVGLSDKNIVAVGLVRISGTANYDYDASVIYVNSNDLVKIKTAKTQSNTTACLYIIYTD